MAQISRSSKPEEAVAENWWKGLFKWRFKGVFLAEIIDLIKCSYEQWMGDNMRSSEDLVKTFCSSRSYCQNIGCALK